MTNDPILNMTSSSPPPPAAPTPQAPAVEKMEPTSMPVSAAPPAETPPAESVTQIDLASLEPKPVTPDPMAIIMARLDGMEQQINSFNRPQQAQPQRPAPRQPADPLDGILDETPAWARTQQEAIARLEHQAQVRASIDQQLYANAQRSAQTQLLDEELSKQTNDFTKQFPDIHKEIVSDLRARCVEAIQANPFGHGITPQRVASEYLRAAQVAHRIAVMTNAARASAVADQAKVNAAAAVPVTGGTAPQNIARPAAIKGDPLTSDQVWGSNGLVNQRMRAVNAIV